MKVITHEARVPSSQVRFASIVEIGGLAAIASGFTKREAVNRAMRLGEFKYGYCWKENLLQGLRS